MPPRSTPPPPRGSVLPPNDSTTYRDLLYFEERLKTNAARLQRRKARYQLFLVQLLLIITILLVEVLLPPETSILAIPCKVLLQQVLPNVYTSDVKVRVHPYFSTGLLFVSVTTLVLFFASGMYSEKIAYANKYVPHANRALRSFNMYLNVRKPPLRSKFYFNPISFFFPRPEEEHHASRRRDPSRSPSPGRNPRSQSISSSVPIPSIPPATNPRGELIFSSRVDKSFRDSYERYRTQFERRREEKEREERKNWWQERLHFWKKSSTVPPGSSSPTLSAQTIAPAARTVSSSSTPPARGRGSRSMTPPVKTAGASGGANRPRDKSGGSSSSPSPPRGRARRDQGSEGDMRTVALERSIIGQVGHSVATKVAVQEGGKRAERMR